MRRVAWGWVIVALVAIVAGVSVAAWVAQRSDSTPEAITPTILQLVQQTDSHEGERVRVTGDVRVFEHGTPDEYYVLEQDGQFRVAIRGVPLDTLRPLTNERMTIEGDFHFEEGVGRYIDVTDWGTPAELTITIYPYRV